MYLCIRMHTQLGVEDNDEKALLVLHIFSKLLRVSACLYMFAYMFVDTFLGIYKSVHVMQHDVARILEDVMG